VWGVSRTGKGISIFDALHTENGEKKEHERKKNWLKNKYTYNNFGRMQGGAAGETQTFGYVS